MAKKKGFKPWSYVKRRKAAVLVGAGLAVLKGAVGAAGGMVAKAAISKAGLMMFSNPKMRASVRRRRVAANTRGPRNWSIHADLPIETAQEKAKMRREVLRLRRQGKEVEILTQAGMWARIYVRKGIARNPLLMVVPNPGPYSPGDDLVVETGDKVMSIYGTHWVTATGVAGGLWTSEDKNDIKTGRGRGLRHTYVKAVQKKGTGKWYPVKCERGEDIFTVLAAPGINPNRRPNPLLMVVPNTGSAFTSPGHTPKQHPSIFPVGSILPSLNKEHGFYGTILHWAEGDYSATPKALDVADQAWVHAMLALIKDRKFSQPEAVLWLDSTTGRHFADAVIDSAGGSKNAQALAKGFNAAWPKWSKWVAADLKKWGYGRIGMNPGPYYEAKYRTPRVGPWAFSPVFTDRKQAAQEAAQLKRMGYVARVMSIPDADQWFVAYHPRPGKSPKGNPDPAWHKAHVEEYGGRYAGDVKAGHKKAAEYWKGALAAEAAAVAAGNPGACVVPNGPKICALREVAKTGKTAKVSGWTIPAAVAQAFLRFYDGQTAKGKKYLEQLPVPKMMLAACKNAKA